MERLAEVSGLVVSQQKEWGEILTGFETRNRYVVMDGTGSVLYGAAEEKGGIGGWLGRQFLKAHRPFKLSVITMEGTLVIRAIRPFRFIFHELAVYDGQGELLGTIKQRWAVLRRLYSVRNASGEEMFELIGPFWHPWTFEIRKDGELLGKITKKWSGLLKESFTDADHFGVELPKTWDVKTKAVFLGAVFLIDFAHFEQ